jgi:hypothetical protein
MRLFKRVLVDLLLLLVVLSFMVPAASATITVEHLYCDSEMYDLIENEAFTAHAWIANNAVSTGGYGGGGGNHELKLCGGDNENDGDTADYCWNSGKTEPFVLSYNQGSETLTFEICGETLTYTLPADESFTDLFIRGNAESRSSILIEDLELNGQEVGRNIAFEGDDPEVDILWIKNINSCLRDGFTLEGNLKMSWTGGVPPNGQHLSMKIKAATIKSQNIPEFSNIAVPVIAVLGLIGVFGRRRN